MKTNPNTQEKPTLDQLLRTERAQASDGFSARVMAAIQTESQLPREKSTSITPLWRRFLPAASLSAAAAAIAFACWPAQPSTAPQGHAPIAEAPASPDNINEEDIESFLRSSSENQALFLSYLEEYTADHQSDQIDVLDQV